MKNAKIWSFFNLCIAFLLIFLSGSKTSFLIAVLMLFVGLIGYVRVRYKVTEMLGIIALFAAVIFIGGLLTDNIFVSNIGSNQDYISIFSVHIPLTGRLTIWDFSINAILEKPLFGYGYGGFWGVSGNSDIYGYGLGEFDLNDAHNGFVNLFLSVGIIGGSIIMITIVYYVFQIYIYYLKNNSSLGLFYMYFLILVLFINLTESTLLKATNFYQFLFFYIIFYFINDRRSIHDVKSLISR